MLRAVVPLSLALIACGDPAASPPVPDAGLADAPVPAGCTVAFSGALVGSAPCDLDPAIADSGALDSYVLAGAPRTTTIQLSASGTFTFGSGEADVVVTLPVTIAGAPAAKSYQRGAADFVSARNIFVDTADPTTHAFTSWELADDAAVTLTFTSIAMTSENADDSGQQRFIGHGTLDLTLEPSATNQDLVGGISAHVAF